MPIISDSPGTERLKLRVWAALDFLQTGRLRTSSPQAVSFMHLLYCDSGPTEGKAAFSRSLAYLLVA